MEAGILGAAAIRKSNDTDPSHSKSEKRYPFCAQNPAIKLLSRGVATDFYSQLLKSKLCVKICGRAKESAGNVSLNWISSYLIKLSIVSCLSDFGGFDFSRFCLGFCGFQTIFTYWTTWEVISRHLIFFPWAFRPTFVDDNLNCSASNNSKSEKKSW